MYDEQERYHDADRDSNLNIPDDGQEEGERHKQEIDPGAHPVQAPER